MMPPSPGDNTGYVRVWGLYLSSANAMLEGCCLSLGVSVQNACERLQCTYSCSYFVLYLSVLHSVRPINPEAPMALCRDDARQNGIAICPHIKRIIAPIVQAMEKTGAKLSFCPESNDLLSPREDRERKVLVLFCRFVPELLVSSFMRACFCTLQQGPRGPSRTLAGLR
jgi:hypothetical protein